MFSFIKETFFSDLSAKFSEEVIPVEKLQHVYPQNLIYEYVKRAIDYYENGKQMELLAYVIGHKIGNKLIGYELIFPLQMSDKSLNNSWEKRDKG